MCVVDIDRADRKDLSAFKLRYHELSLSSFSSFHFAHKRSRVSLSSEAQKSPKKREEGQKKKER